MRIFLLSIFCLTLFSFQQKKSHKKIIQYPVSGIITATSSYCGGARPSGEILSQLATLRPQSNKKIYLKKGEINSFDSKVFMELTTDTAGKFRAKLPAGKYLIVDEEKKDLSYYNKLLKEYKTATQSFEAVDTICLKEWYLKPDFTFEVKSDEVKNISVNYRKECFNLPCTQFRGPYPP